MRNSQLKMKLKSKLWFEDIQALKNGVYFYSLSSDMDVRGKVIINN